MDDVLEARNENGHLKANILFTEEGQNLTVEDMDGFERILCFHKGKMIGGGTANIRRTEVVLTEENDYTETHPLRELEGEYETIGLHTEWIKPPVLGDGTITIEKAANLTTPGTYKTAFGFFGEDWAEIFVVTIVVTVPLRVHYNSVDTTHGKTVTVNLTAPNYSTQYLYVYGSRPWTLENVETAKITVSPLSGSGYNYEWDSAVIYISKPSALAVDEFMTTTFRIQAGTRWIDVVVNLHPPNTFHFVDPREDEPGAPAGNEPVYIYL